MGISSERNNRVVQNWKCILICFCMALANCQYGFDTASIGGFQAMVGFLQVFGYPDPERPSGWNIGTRSQQLIASTLNIGTIAGVAVTGIFGRYYGRRPAIWLATLIAFAGAGVQVGATSLGALCGGRVLIGMSNAFFFTFSNVYCVESTPAHLRAVVTSFFGIWVNIGSILGSVADQQSQQHPDRLAYQIPLASLFAIPATLSVLVFFIPESPRWLLVQGRQEEARKSLERLRGGSLESQFFEEEFTEMVRGIEEEKSLASTAAFLDMFKATDLRRTIVCIGVVLSHSSSGLWLFIAYSTFFFQMAGINDAFRMSIYATLATLGGTMVGMYLTYKHLGRRSMMMTGTVCAGLCMFASALAYTISPGTATTGKVIAAFSIIYGCLYNGFSGTLSWALASELPSSRLRVFTVSFATGVNYFFSWLASYCTPYFINSNALNWGGKYCWIWAGSNAITLVFFYLVLPEIKGRSLEEIDELFQNRVSVKNFPKYECISSTRAHEIVIQDLKHDGSIMLEDRVERVEKTAEA